MDQRDENKVEEILISKGKLVVSIFTAGIGVIIFVIVPIYDIKTDQALISQSIQTINLNHESHIQSILDEIKEIKQKDSDQDKLILQIIGGQK